MEEGEIDSEDETRSHLSSQASRVDTSGSTYSPAFEWPTDDEDAPSPSYSVLGDESRPTSNSPHPLASLRLVVRHSSILRKHHKLALLDGFSEIQIGRDLAPSESDTPRVRLKEMEVSKLHATIYRDHEQVAWAIVDMGSKHGTFLESTTVSTSGPSTALQEPTQKGVRLSAPRVASMPRSLRHLDQLSIGGTTFEVHVHEGEPPCEACSPQGDVEIPLFQHRSGDGTASKKRKLDVTEEMRVVAPRGRDPKKAMALLKRSLLSSAAASSSSSSPARHGQPYVDRSAKRRALHPDHTPAIIPTASASGTSSPSASASVPATPPLQSPPPSSLPADNIGLRLLMKQGWQPGSALGLGERDSSPGLVEPLAPPPTSGRAGIGTPVRPPGSIAAAQDGDWKDDGKRRRWAEFRQTDDVA
ncbi:uncharacterized protein BXZ73DRAFT_86782 [Epithele typhae]|uniref:uncharacterized protein n=1 Tax=Epithele typhae TaxID=378194 RepID=UPI002007F17A|nr:uncharacterized protein BXZ73DRAFT_86782 [Epithele typhae]KAH9945259.1 hypothetical protein BXZ73DRAFT_86782 [Epithele typhae]